jgi:hypothetical protein
MQGPIQVGSSCSLTFAYDPASLSSPIGLAYDTLTVSAISDAGQTDDFVKHFPSLVRFAKIDLARAANNKVFSL